ncbi:MAG: S8 family serine peptidase [Rhodanobacteraceae bacterium]|nr:S8 family serine peptidase [Rhodanobacteraceae bacterium]
MHTALQKGIQRTLRYNVLALALFSSGAYAQSDSVTAKEREAYADRVDFSQPMSDQDIEGFIVYYNGAEKNLPQKKGGKMARSETEAAEALSLAANDADRAGKRLGVSLSVARELATGGILIRTPHAKGTPARKIDAERVMVEIAKNSNVSWIEPDRRAYPYREANDAFFRSQWNLFSDTAGINVEPVWESTRGSTTNGPTISPVIVAVIDTGITPHSELVGQTVDGYDFISDSVTARDGDGRDPNPNDEGDWRTQNECGTTPSVSYPMESTWHGTHVAGIVAAKNNNSWGVSGVAPEAKILPLRVLGRCGGRTSDIAEAITWAAGGTLPVGAVPAGQNPNRAKVINLSLGNRGMCSRTYQLAINTALENGALVVVAAGNDNVDVSGVEPAGCSGVLTVAATTKQGDRASYSNFGFGVDVAAPGGAGGDSSTDRADNPRTGDIPSTVQSGWTTYRRESYSGQSGTSMAAPHVAGLAALLVSRFPALNPSELENVISRNVKPVPTTCDCGTGIVDAGKAFGALARKYGLNVPPFASFDVQSNGLNVAFKNRSSDADGTTTYNWTFGDGSTSTVNHPQKVYANPGTYLVTLNVRDNSGYLSKVTESILVTNSSAQTNVPLTNQVSQVVSADGWPSQRTFTVSIPAGAKNFRVWTAGGTGTPGLFVRYGSQVTDRDYDCTANYLGTEGNACIRTNPPAGTAYVMLKGYDPYSNVRLTAEYTPPAPAAH